MAGKALEQRVYRVDAPYVTLKVITPDGPAVRGFYAGAMVTGLLDQAQLDHHLAQDPPMISEVGEEAVPAEGVQGGPDTPAQAQTAEPPAPPDEPPPPPPDEGSQAKAPAAKVRTTAA
jgi:hypothetical protein